MNYAIPSLQKLRGDLYMWSKYKKPLRMLCFFELIAFIMWQATGKIFYLFNFSYLGLSISVGFALMLAGWKYGRQLIQLLVGLYMLCFVGLYHHENMQIEGFWYYLGLGVFQGSTLHYAIAKLGGPLFFGRGWCGYACWTPMVLDFLPYKQGGNDRPKLRSFRYVVLVLSLILAGLAFSDWVRDKEQYIFTLFLLGNLAYYLAGALLAFTLRDNRAFCKYLCPITVFLKPMSYFSLWRIRCDEEKCISCGKCVRVCPMNVDVKSDSRDRKYATECILCNECVKVCPVKALR